MKNNNFLGQEARDWGKNFSAEIVEEENNSLINLAVEFNEEEVGNLINLANEVDKNNYPCIKDDIIYFLVKKYLQGVLPEGVTLEEGFPSKETEKEYRGFDLNVIWVCYRGGATWIPASLLKSLREEAERFSGDSPRNPLFGGRNDPPDHFLEKVDQRLMGLIGMDHTSLHNSLYQERIW